MNNPKCECLDWHCDLLLPIDWRQFMDRTEQYHVLIADGCETKHDLRLVRKEDGHTVWER